MTPAGTGVVDLSDEARAALADLLSVYAARRPGWDAEAPVEVLEAEVLVAGRPGIIDVIADAGGHLLHLPLGLRAPGDEGRLVPDGDDAVIGTLENEDGPATVFEATRDAEVAVLLLRQVSDEDAQPTLARPVREDRSSSTVAMDDRIAFTVYHEVVDGPRPDLELFLALDEVGFNHLAAPLAVWRRSGRDLGVVQEFLPGASSGYALALTSVRDLYASGGPPELAGGDFGAEAHRLGTMTARMHVCSDKAFGRRTGDVGRWADEVEAALRELAPHVLDRPDAEQLLAELRALHLSSPVIRSHGDFHLGRTCRTEQGWYVIDFAPGGRPTSMVGVVATEDEDDDAGPPRSGGDHAPPAGARGEGPLFRSPVADVADMLWSFGYVAGTAADERDPSGHEGLGELAQAWEARNRRAFLAGYLGVPGISGLVPPGREALRVLTASFELVRAAMHDARRHDD